MSNDEELQSLRQENEALRQALQGATETIAQLHEQLSKLQEQQAKDSHNSHLPPSSDRFVRVPKSLREKSGKKPGGQKGHRGHHLMQVQQPDQFIVHNVECCGFCQQDLAKEQGELVENRQVFDLPSQRLWVTQYQVQEKWCAQCWHLTRARFPEAVSAPAQYGEGI